MSEIIGVPNHLVDIVWREVAPFLEPAIARNPGYEAPDVREAILTGHMQLFIAVNDGQIDGAMVTQVHTFPRCVSVFLLFMGGRRMKTWLADMEIAIVTYAERIGAQNIETLARRGFGALFSAERTGTEYFRRTLQ